MTKNTEKYLTKPLSVAIIPIICTALWGSAYPSVKSGYELFQIAGEDISSKILFAGYRFFLNENAFTLSNLGALVLVSAGIIVVNYKKAQTRKMVK